MNKITTILHFTYYFLVACLFLSSFSFTLSAAVVLEGKVSSKEDALIGATIMVKGQGILGTTTDLEGNFSLEVEALPVTLIVSYIGFTTKEITVDNNEFLNILLMQGLSLDQLVVTGTRGKPRTIIGSAVPIDNINAGELKSSGQKTVEQMLNYKVPSYNSSNQTVSDATAHFDPSELRNLGPSRTLVLVNGKRKNQSALVYVNDTPGKGEVGTDMKSIPQESIERIEVLRDGAAAQYGSDAIAGVINIVLKDKTRGEVSVGTGMTTKGDGFTYDIGVNKGFNLGKRANLNLTASYYHQNLTNRAGEPGSDGLFDVDGTNPWIQDNPDLGMTIGQPEYDKFSAIANFGLRYGRAHKFYTTLGYTLRSGKSFALYRAPYWVTDDAGLLTPEGEDYVGFQPTFETDINDATFIIGTKNRFSGWNTDVSLTYGYNDVAYLIGNTINVDLLPNSPTSFDAGAYTFANLIGNIDVSKSFNALTLSIGTEARRELFEVVAGQEESWIEGGAQSFPGLQPSNALSETRTSVGVYAGADYDFSENTFVGGALRFENYSDFGSNLSWKLNARQFLLDQNLAVRSSISTGFRAPSLHQVYLSNVQTLVSGGTISNQGTFNNVSEVIRGLGVPALDAETSLNITAGLTYKVNSNFSIAADFYNINIDNRVLFTGEIGFDGDDMNTNPVEQVLIDNSVTSIKYFVNALDTRTTGVDLVADYNNLRITDKHRLDIVLSANFNKTSIRNDSILSPGVVGEVGYEIFNRKEQSRVTSARPNIKTLLGLTYKMGKFRVGLNNTYFGEVTWRHATDPTLDQTFAGKLVTDLIFRFAPTEALSLDLTANNIFNIYPDVIEPGSDVVTDLGGRFKYPWEVNQFGFSGTILKLGASYQF